MHHSGYNERHSLWRQSAQSVGGEIVATAYPSNAAVTGWGLTPDQQEVLDTADAVARTTFFPLAPRMDKDEWWPEQTMPELARMGVLGVTVDPQYGGGGGGPVPPGVGWR